MYLSLILKNKLPFEELLKKLNELDILFTKQKPAGILPLSANALNVNVNDNAINSLSCKGRFYFSLVVEEEKESEILSKLKDVFCEFGAKVVN
jgi:hypothetical protein